VMTGLGVTAVSPEKCTCQWCPNSWVA
jgi:hypothetical protein